MKNLLSTIAIICLPIFNANCQLTLLSNGNVGIGTSIASTKLNINGDLGFSQKAIISEKTGIINNFDRNGSSIILISNASGSAISLSGITGGVENMIIFIYVGANSDLTILHNNIGSSGINQIVTNTINDVLIDNGGGATLMYVLGKWRIIGIAN